MVTRACMHAKSLQSCPTLVTPWTVAHQNPCDSPGKNTGVGCHVLLQRIFPTQGSTLHLLPLLLGRWALYHYCHRGSLVHTFGAWKSDLTSTLPRRELAGLQHFKGCFYEVPNCCFLQEGRADSQNWRAGRFCFSVLKLTLNDTLTSVL